VNKQGPGKIDWCDFTWNPVTGCYHGCEYCYARRIAERFSTDLAAFNDLYSPEYWQGKPVYEAEPHHRAFPFAFAPTFYPSRLGEPHNAKRPVRIFVCSMADLFGEWVPDRWIGRVLETADWFRRHTFQFLTKNPERLVEFNPWPDNCWVGATATDEPSMTRALAALADVQATVRFVSAEPLLGPLFGMDSGGAVAATAPAGAMGCLDWLIIGAQTGPRAVAPDPDWVVQAESAAALDGVPLWHKDTLCHPAVARSALKRWPQGV
jgi:protein gp37